MYDDEEEPSAGRMVVLDVAGSEVDRSLVLEAGVPASGGVFTLRAFQGGVLAGINSIVQLFTWKASADGGTLVAGPHHKGHILALHLATRGHFVLVGDLMKSMTVLAYNDGEDGATLTEIARDPAANWMTAVAIVDDNTFLGAENSYNLLMCKKATTQLAEEDHSRLLTTGAFHLGEFVNCIRHGSMVMDPTASKGTAASDDMDTSEDSTSPAGAGAGAGAGSGSGAGAGSAPSTAALAAKVGTAVTKPKPILVFGTVNGALGVVASLPPADFDFLTRVQAAMAKCVPGVGGFSHGDWRAFRNERLPEPVPATGFIDGDLVETFLDLDAYVAMPTRAAALRAAPADVMRCCYDRCSTKMAAVVRAINDDGKGSDGGDVTTESLMRLVEDLVRLH